MTLEEAIKTYTSNADHERTHGNLQGCLEFRQLAEWLKGYQRLLKEIGEIKAEINYVGAHSDYGMQCVFAVAVAIIDKHLERVTQNEQMFT